MDKELEMVRSLYERKKSGELSLPPKQGLLSWKCPKCASKLSRRSFKAPLFAEAGRDAFANRVIHDHGIPPGLYNITMDHFTCSCGYEHIREKLDKVEF
jgi:predicted RNA-binding Zn-ribbon protein involved in translation (DUF1610 family)